MLKKICLGTGNVVNDIILLLFINVLQLLLVISKYDVPFVGLHLSLHVIISYVFIALIVFIIGSIIVFYLFSIKTDGVL